MKIASSTMAMSSQYSMSQTYSKQESLQVWRDVPNNQSSTAQPEKGQRAGLPLDKLHLSEQAKAALQQALSSAPSSAPAKADNDDPNRLSSLSASDQKKVRVLEKLLTALTGKQFKFQVADGKFLEQAPNAPAIQTQQNASATASSPPARKGWGMQYDFQESYRETEQVSFAATGSIRTEDNREIQFNMQLSMSREFATSNSIHIQAGDPRLTDPLVINYGGAAAELTDTPFAFDLNSDGQKEQLATLKSGSGFLALDQDGDGAITNGKELFGPTQGDGFAELAQYDSDHNSWIDENDPVYEKLRVMTPGTDGQDSLMTLKEAGIGAISLERVSTPFQQKNSSNELLGQTQQTGVFLGENGGVGTIQQVDLAV